MNTEPVRTVLIPIVLAVVIAAGQAFIDGADTRGIVLAVVGALVLLGQEYARSQVVPVGKSESWRPQDETGLTLVETVLILLVVAVAVLAVMLL